MDALRVGRDTVAVVRACEDQVRTRQLAHCGEQMLDPLARRDAPDVEDERRVRRDAETGSDPHGVRPQPFGFRVGKAIAAHVHLVPGHAAGDHVVSLPLRRRDDRRRSTGDPAVERRVERPFQEHLAQARLEHAEWLENVRDASDAAPGCGAGRDRVAEPEHVHDVRSPQLRQGHRQRRRDPHPAVAKGGREVPHGRPLHDRDRRPCCRPVLKIEDRRRQHLDPVAAGDKPSHQLAGGDDRPSKRTRRRPCRRGEEDSEPLPGHAKRLVERP